MPWQEIAVMTIVGAAIFGLIFCFARKSCGGCGHCTCGAEQKKPDAEAERPS